MAKTSIPYQTIKCEHDRQQWQHEYIRACLAAYKEWAPETETNPRIDKAHCWYSYGVARGYLVIDFETFWSLITRHSYQDHYLGDYPQRKRRYYGRGYYERDFSSKYQRKAQHRKKEVCSDEAQKREWRESKRTRQCRYSRQGPRRYWKEKLARKYRRKAREMIHRERWDEFWQEGTKQYYAQINPWSSWD